MRALLRAALHVVYPPHCILTGRYLGEDAGVVPEIDDAALFHHPTAPTSVELALLLQRHFHPDDLALSSVHALWSITTGTTIDRAIHAVKYHARRRLAEHLGSFLARHPELEDLSTEVVIAAVPIHTARRRERGYRPGLRRVCPRGHHHVTPPRRPG